MTERALNRALLARQGLLERWDRPVTEVVESIGAIQSQYWPAVPVALWSRMATLRLEDVYRAFDARELLFGTLLRRTLHAVSAAQHPAYAAMVEGFGVNVWPSSGPAPTDALRALRLDLVEYATATPRTAKELIAFLENAVVGRRLRLADTELAFQRATSWHSMRSWTALVRAPLEGRFGSRTPTGHVAAPCHPRSWPSLDESITGAVRRHLGAFGPAAAEDIAAWLGVRVPPVRQALDRLGAQVVPFADDAGRRLHDLVEAPRPDPETEARVRLLPWFDSVFLAYAPAHRTRILPLAHREAVFKKINGQIVPTILIDGQVAGTWSMAVHQRRATLALAPFARLKRSTRASLMAEAERLLSFAHPQASSHEVAVEAA